MDSLRANGEDFKFTGAMLRSNDLRSKAIKPVTVHSCAQSGDFPTFQNLLIENPALLNEPNPIMAQTPLHLSAAYNNVEIVNLLLQWQGSHVIELEAKNMYGETPLHMAAKNGCTESLELLLSHGAFIDARANNGMTPLHLAVWNPSRTEDSAVKTLLHYGADCSAKDNEGMTPLDHLNGRGNSKLRELLNGHLENQRISHAIRACSETKAKMNELEGSISEIVGLKDLKIQLRKWAKGMVLDERRRALGLKVAARRLPHMAFIGNPGTGKTMVARILGRLLRMLGVLPTDKVTEVQRTDLVGEFVGHTGPKTRRKIKDAEGGILFVDEAYQLIPMQKSDDKDYGLEALEEIMSVMDSGKVVVIFAGYHEPMKRLISSNEGFYRRVSRFLYFDDLSCDDLAEITHLKMNRQTEEGSMYGFKLDSRSCGADAIAEMIRGETTENQRRQRNGGLVDAMLVNARENLDLRLSFECVDRDELVTITLEDLKIGVGVLYGDTNHG